MAEKRIYGRSVQKHDVQSNWEKATNFIPMAGEIIVYDRDENYNYERFKIGDGITNVSSLPFAGGNSIIDATELPTNDINENAIYRTEHTMTIDGTKMYFVDGSGSSPLDIEEFAKSEGASVYINVVNNAQAQSMTASTNTEMHVYIDRETGIAYLNLDNMVLTAGQLFGSLYSMEVSDNGWSTDINSETNHGIYCVYEEINKIYHNYHIFKDSVWTNLTGSGIIDVNALPKSGANENAIYRVGITGADVYLTLVDGVTPVTFETYMAQNGVSLTVNTQVVKTLSESIEQSSTADGGCVYFYVLEDTGVAYLDTGSGIQSFGTYIGNSSLDKGWVEDINSVTDIGFFCVRKTDCTYYICKGGAWSELPVGGSKIELDTTLSQEGQAADAKAVGDAISSVTTTVNNKVDKVDGKDLSTNDFTNEYKSQLDLLMGGYDTGLKYTENSDGTYSVSGIGFRTCTDVIIPSVVNGRNVTGISNSAFDNCSNLTSIKIPDSVTNIGDRAFYNCSNLTSITIPDSVTNIGERILWGCGRLESVTLPFIGDSIKTENDNNQYPLGYIFGSVSLYEGGVVINQSFYGTPSTEYGTSYCIPANLKSVTITGGNILYGAFSNCSMLTNINIPNNITKIGGRAFDGCSGLTSLTIPDSVAEIDDFAFAGANNATIYCEVDSQPEGWNANWNFSNCPVVWNFAPDFVSVNEKFSDYITQTELEIYINEAILGGAW